MINDNEIIDRARDFEMAPDVEIYVQRLQKDGILTKLSAEDNLNAETIQNTSLKKMCDIFVEETREKIESGEGIIFGNSATIMYKCRNS